ncbi:MAG: hypothetical protein CL799_12700 [Chromatiales bacterium]|jgi:predicted small lipoprotein YifL|nr:hypothetical protein [Chromatiales bacterium]MDP6150513.1 lipoprotein [Gammaproteobacteria bacterium]MDP7092890.1 lipoprotein [Gammaproteobacteria bacterium]MDP7270258.1 lipoprotein [Gammaproteobacteria bacterium]HJP05194.1 lipoprotein [Gammaproteobacteria bacterium]
MIEQWKQITALCVLSVTLSGCGLKGDLYIPVEGEAAEAAVGDTSETPESVETPEVPAESPGAVNSTVATTEPAVETGGDAETTEDDEPTDAMPAP